MNTHYKVPNKLSEVVRLAVNDLRQIAADTRYTVDFSRWHEPRPNTCFVCLAGAYMAQKLELDPTQQTINSSNIVPFLRDSESLRMYDAACALDNVREGRMYTAAVTFYSPGPKAERVRILKDNLIDFSDRTRVINRLWFEEAPEEVYDALLARAEFLVSRGL